MNTSCGKNAHHFVLTVLWIWIFASSQRSEAISWRKQPKKPTILVEGVNNTGQSLVWAFVPDGGGRVQSVPFRRQRDAADSPVDLASNTNGGEFTVFPRFLSNYSASTPATLKLKNVVTKDAEFIYSIEVIYLKNVLLAPGFKDEVQVIVHAAPPPTTGTTTGAPSDVGARPLSDAVTWGSIGACLAVVILVCIILIACCFRIKRGGARRDRPVYSEADGYRMNKAPPSSALGTASPAYVEARRYFPANAPRRQDDHPPPISYGELSHNKPFIKSPRPRYSTEYTEVSTEKRPPSTGGQGGGGSFELWC